MKTTYKITRPLTGLMILCLLTGSCDSFVEVQQPDSQLSNEVVFENYATASAALTDIYAKIRDKGMLSGNSSGLSNALGNYADELLAYGQPSNRSFAFYNNALLASNTDILMYWNDTYSQIYAANSVLEGVASSTGLSYQNKQQLQGEALFIRALLHFYLVNLFGEIPYITQTDYKKNSVVHKMPPGQVYEKIVQDLQGSIAMLEDNYTDPARVRPNRLTARALLARVYLYDKSYAQAAREASAVLDHSELFDLEDPQSAFLLSSKETIWQLQSASSGQNSQEGATFIFVSGPPPLVALSAVLVDSFSPGDLRRSLWIRDIGNPPALWHHAYKYKQQEFTPSSMEYSIVLRLAEQYLIRAEARAMRGDLAGALEDLDKIRQRAALANTTAQSQPEILQAIVQERRWEFFTEFGHRFFDLKRLGRLDATLSQSKPGWKSSDGLFPLPQNELSANPNLRPQNPGY